jgi:hypothetical protein
MEGRERQERGNERKEREKDWQKGKMMKIQDGQLQ